MEYLLIFSQDDEDLILYHVLKDVRKVCWIDAGANDPVHASVTKFFSLRGGAGINIELQHGFWKKLEKDRPHDKNIEAGVSNQKGVLTLFGREGSQIASFAKKSGLNKGARPRKVPAETLRDICRRYFSPKDVVHFLKIDVEGWEKQCLEGMDFQYIKPWILCIESSGSENSPDEWETIIEAEGYEFAMQYRANRYYVSKEHRELKKLFQSPEKLRSTYSVTRYSDYKINEKCENAVLRIKASFLLKPVRFLYNWNKNYRMRKLGGECR